MNLQFFTILQMHDTMGNFLNDDQGNEVDEILGATVEENLPITHRSFEGYKYIYIYKFKCIN